MKANTLNTEEVPEEEDVEIILSEDEEDEGFVFIWIILMKEKKIHQNFD